MGPQSWSQLQGQRGPHPPQTGQTSPKVGLQTKVLGGKDQKLNEALSVTTQTHADCRIPFSLTNKAVTENTDEIYVGFS